MSNYKGQDIWLDQLREGNEEAFNRLVSSYQKQVYRTCLGITHNNSDADDLTQEVFIEVFRSIGKFRDESNISTWLYRIAINKSLNYVRNQKRLRFFQTIGIISSPYIADNETKIDYPNESTHNEHLKKILERAIDSLTEKQRTAFVLNKIEELPYKEIAHIMNVSLSTVESLLYRARQNLQKNLMVHYKELSS